MKALGIFGVVIAALAAGIGVKIGYDKYKLSKMPKETEKAPTGGGGGGMSSGNSAPVVIEKVVEKPVEVIKYVQRIPIRKEISNIVSTAPKGPAVSFSGLESKYKNDVY